MDNRIHVLAQHRHTILSVDLDGLQICILLNDLLSLRHRTTLILGCLRIMPRVNVSWNFSSVDAQWLVSGAYIQDSRSVNAQKNESVGRDARSNRGIRLRPVSELREALSIWNICLELTKLWTADMYRGVFKFGVFNAVQSTCFEPVSDKLVFFASIILSPPSFHQDHENGREYGTFCICFFRSLSDRTKGRQRSVDRYSSKLLFDLKWLSSADWWRKNGPFWTLVDRDAYFAIKEAIG